MQQDEIIFDSRKEQATCVYCGNKIYKRPKQIAICGRCVAEQIIKSNPYEETD